MQENYELLYLISANYTALEIVPIMDKVKTILGEHNAKITKEENLNKQRLAYPIKKNSHGYYILIEMILDKKELKAINNALRIFPEVLRYLITIKKEKTEKEIQLEKRLQEKLTKEKEQEIEKLATAPKETPKKEAPVKVSAEELDKKLDEILKGEDII
jgi:small subunit ribosomal protein S6